MLVACLSAVTLAQDDLVSDAQRLAMLKPQLTLKEAEKIIKGKKVFGIGCGLVPTKQADGLLHTTESVSYLFQLQELPDYYTGGKKRKSKKSKEVKKETEITFVYWGDGIGLARIEGRGFVYVRDGDRFVRESRPVAEGKERIDLPE
jgi:hypothetical protein